MMSEPEDRRGLEQMLADIRKEVRLTRGLTGCEAFSERVMQAMANVPRHRFVPRSLRSMAYANGPLPIGHGQTISQPYIVALMSELLDTRPTHTVLEIGTGCGYQTAVLAELVERVQSLEIVPDLARAARDRLDDLGYANVDVRCADGHSGWRERAPYDGIVVTAAPESVPRALLEQLRPDAHLVIPVGPQHLGQVLTVFTRRQSGGVASRDIIPVAFVPLTASI
jgi:protein-L-isoaspartate(D-aspartate) O-methyltransferase